MSIYFITGTSGAGKTTLVEVLRNRLPAESFQVRDFDEAGVPAYRDNKWRRDTTENWLQISVDNEKNGISTIICGVSVPSEIIESFNYEQIGKVTFGLMKASDETITQRLKERGWNTQLIQDNLNWAHYLEKEVKSQPNHYIFENSEEIKPEQLAENFIKWIGIPL